jgi:DNA-binding NarL/FixJ family response regulator
MIKIKIPDVRVLALTMDDEEECFWGTMRGGAEGYLLKNEVATELFPAIRKIRRGGNYVSPVLSEKLSRV